MLHGRYTGCDGILQDLFSYLNVTSDYQLKELLQTPILREELLDVPIHLDGGGEAALFSECPSVVHHIHPEQVLPTLCYLAGAEGWLRSYPLSVPREGRWRLNRV